MAHSLNDVRAEDRQESFDLEELHEARALLEGVETTPLLKRYVVLTWCIRNLDHIDDEDLLLAWVVLAAANAYRRLTREDNHESSYVP